MGELMNGSMATRTVSISVDPVRNNEALEKYL